MFRIYIQDILLTGFLGIWNFIFSLDLYHVLPASQKPVILSRAAGVIVGSPFALTSYTGSYDKNDSVPPKD